NLDVNSIAEIEPRTIGTKPKSNAFWTFFMNRPAPEQRQPKAAVDDEQARERRPQRSFVRQRVREIDDVRRRAGADRAAAPPRRRSKERKTPWPTSRSRPSVGASPRHENSTVWDRTSGPAARPDTESRM